MDSINLSYRELSEIRLEEIIDIKALDELFDDFSEITGYPIALLDIYGKVLINKNWQDICTKFHKCHPESNKNCLESTTILSFGAELGEVKRYKCKNNLWDISTPIYVQGKHLGNIFMGQFFYEDEEIDYSLFTRQAERYGFNTEAYLEALDAVPVLNREKVDMAIRFNCKMANIISNMGYKSVVLSKLLKERKRELKESHNKINTLFKSMNEMVILFEIDFDPYGKAQSYTVKDCNNALLNNFKYKKDDILDKSLSELFGLNLNEHREAYLRVVNSGESYEYFEYLPHINKSFIVSVVPSMKNQCLAIYTDVSEIQQMQKQILSKNKELENYLYIASHDLRSPLVNIQGFSERLKKQTDKIHQLLEKNEDKSLINTILENDIPRTLDFVFNNVKKMDGLIKGLLIISRTGRAQMTVDRIRMTDLFEKLFFQMNYQLDSLDVTCRIEELPDCFGDYALINRLFSNIIENAIKYRDKSRALTITIRGEKKYKYSVYTVEDNGLGIARRHLEKIWDIFYRVDPVNSENGEGLGLSIVKRILDKHKGRGYVESEDGSGTRFRIELPNEMF